MTAEYPLFFSLLYFGSGLFLGLMLRRSLDARRLKSIADQERHARDQWRVADSERSRLLHQVHLLKRDLDGALVAADDHADRAADAEEQLAMLRGSVGLGAPDLALIDRLDFDGAKPLAHAAEPTTGKPS